MVTSCLVAVVAFAVWFLVNYLKRHSLTPFVVYRILLAVAIVALLAR